MGATVKVGGDQATVSDFSAYKALMAMQVLSQVESAVRELVHEAGDFRTEYAARHVTRISRAEARRQFAPQPAMRRRELPDGLSVIEPVMDDEDRVVLGPDPLGHLTDADWAATGGELVIPALPDEEAIVAAMIPRAFEVAEESVMRLLALALASNSDLERWDGEGVVEDKLTEEATRLKHRATIGELVEVAVATIDVAREQLVEPLGKMRAALRQFQAARTSGSQEAQAPEPMSVETERSPASSTPSPDGTDGPPERSSTALAGDSS